MKKYMIICMLLFPTFAIAQHSPEAIYTLTETGIQPKSKFINAFDSGNYNNITPYVRYKISQVTSLDKLYNYQIEMSKYKSLENDAGVANVIEISSGNKKLLTIKNCEAWLNMATYSDWGSTITTQPFITAHLSGYTHLLP